MMMEEEVREDEESDDGGGGRGENSTNQYRTLNVHVLIKFQTPY